MSDIPGDPLATSDRPPMSWAHRCPNLAFVSSVFAVFGRLLRMVADRPDLRARPDRPALVVETLAGVGAGFSAVGDLSPRGLARAQAQAFAVSAGGAAGRRTES